MHDDGGFWKALFCGLLGAMAYLALLSVIWWAARLECQVAELTRQVERLEERANRPAANVR